MNRDYLIIVALLFLTICSIGFVSADSPESADVLEDYGQLDHVSEELLSSVPTPGSDDYALDGPVDITLSPESAAAESGQSGNVSEELFSSVPTLGSDDYALDGPVDITLSPESATAESGQTIRFSAVGTGLPENAHILWSTSDESVGIVDASGLFTAVAAGEVLVTVTLESDPAVTASATVAVSDPVPGVPEEDSPDVSVMSVAEAWSGSGTEADPYRIADAADLVALAESVNGGTNYTGEYFLQTADIDLSSVCGIGGASWTPIGSYTTYADNNPFSGTFDGGSHLIQNLYINSSSSYQGLFGYAINANFMNIGLKDVNVTGRSYVGGLVGYNSASSGTASISDCHSTGSVTGNYSVGGLVGYNDASSGNTSISTCYSTGNVTGGIRVGGLVGRNSASDGNTSISACYSTGNVTGGSFVGGLVGYNSASDGNTSIINCYSTGSVSATGDYVGGLAGSNYAYYDGTASISSSVALNPSVTGTSNVSRVVGYNTGTLENTYALSTLAGTGGTDVSPKDAASQTFYEKLGWDFTNIWQMDTSLSTYPVLQWQTQGTPEDLIKGIPLRNGWNYISVPKTLSAGNNTAEPLLKNVNTDNRSPLTYDAEAGKWLLLNASDRIHPLTGYWIYAAAPAEIPLLYPDTPQIPAVKTVYPGWNAIGLSSDYPTPAENALAGVAWRAALPWNLTTGGWDPAIISGGTGGNSQERLMTLKNGYWLYASEAGTLIGLTA